MDLASLATGIAIGGALAGYIVTFVKSKSSSTDNLITSDRVERLRDALRKIIRNETTGANATVKRMVGIARTALKTDDLHVDAVKMNQRAADLSIGRFSGF